MDLTKYVTKVSNTGSLLHTGSLIHTALHTGRTLPYVVIGSLCRLLLRALSRLVGVPPPRIDHLFCGRLESILPRRRPEFGTARFISFRVAN